MHVDGAALCRRYGVKELSLFGSAVGSEMRPESELTGRTVDLVTRRGLKPWVRPAVLKDARVIYAA